MVNDLDNLKGWPDTVKTLQKNWIRSSGTYIDFPLESNPSVKIRVFTTRPDTIYGVTFIALAPNHPLLLSSTNQQDGIKLSDTIREQIQSLLSEMKENVNNKTQTKKGTYYYLYLSYIFYISPYPVANSFQSVLI